METVWVQPSFPGTTSGSQGPSRPVSCQKKPYPCCTDSLCVPHEVPGTLIQTSLDGKWALKRGLFPDRWNRRICPINTTLIPWQCDIRRYLQGSNTGDNEVKGIIDTSQISGFEAGYECTFYRHWEKGGEKRAVQGDERANMSRYCYTRYLVKAAIKRVRI